MWHWLLSGAQPSGDRFERSSLGFDVQEGRKVQGGGRPGGMPRLIGIVTGKEARQASPADIAFDTCNCGWEKKLNTSQPRGKQPQI
jgi:hypothetical protein